MLVLSRLIRQEYEVFVYKLYFVGYAKKDQEKKIKTALLRKLFVEKSQIFNIILSRSFHVLMTGGTIKTITFLPVRW